MKRKFNKRFFFSKYVFTLFGLRDIIQVDCGFASKSLCLRAFVSCKLLYAISDAIMLLTFQLSSLRFILKKLCNINEHHITTASRVCIMRNKIAEKYVRNLCILSYSMLIFCIYVPLEHYITICASYYRLRKQGDDNNQVNI